MCFCTVHVAPLENVFTRSERVSKGDATALKIETIFILL